MWVLNQSPRALGSALRWSQHTWFGPEVVLHYLALFAMHYLALFAIQLILIAFACVPMFSVRAYLIIGFTAR